MKVFKLSYNFFDKNRIEAISNTCKNIGISVIVFHDPIEDLLHKISQEKGNILEKKLLKKHENAWKAIKNNIDQYIKFLREKGFEVIIYKEKREYEPLSLRTIDYILIFLNAVILLAILMILYPFQKMKKIKKLSDEISEKFYFPPLKNLINEEKKKFHNIFLYAKELEKNLKKPVALITMENDENAN